MKHREAILLLGGATSVARAIGMNPPAVVKWTQRGIPPLHWGAVCDLAAKQGVHITRAELLAGSPYTDGRSEAETAA